MAKRKFTGTPAGSMLSNDSGWRLPQFTVAQRTAIADPQEGQEIWNKDLKRKEIYNGSFWVSAGGNSGETVEWPGAGALPPYLVACDGSILAVNDTNAYAISILGSTWGVSGQLPNDQGRATVGAGTGVGLTARTVGEQAIGEEAHALAGAELPTHTHTGAAHTHPLAGSGFANITLNAGDDKIQAEIIAGPSFSNNLQAFDLSVDNNDLTTLGSAVSLQGNTGARSASESGGPNSIGTGTGHNNMQPSSVKRKCMVL